MNSNRIISVDRYRGFVVFCMCFFITAAEFPCLGILSRFANNSATTRIMIFNEMSVADLINPIFIFLISLSYQGSFDKRYKISGNKAYLHFIFRYLVFMGLGSIMVSVEDFFTQSDKDPLIIMTILTCMSIILLIISIIIKFIPKFYEDIKKLIKKVMYTCLILLGIIGIILAIRDDILIFTGSNMELYKHWSILSEIGFTGLLVIPTLKFNLKEKISLLFSVIVLYTSIQMLPGIIEKFDIIVLGGIVGTIGYLIIMLVGIIIMELYKNKKYYMYLLFCTILGILSYILFKILPLNTSAITSNYVVFSSLVASIIFGILNLFNNKKFKFEYFVWWGRNPLPLFCIFLIIRLIEKIWCPAIDTSFIVAFLYTFGSISLLSTIAYKLYKKNIIIKL